MAGASQHYDAGRDDGDSAGGGQNGDPGRAAALRFAGAPDEVRAHLVGSREVFDRRWGSEVHQDSSGPGWSSRAGRRRLARDSRALTVASATPSTTAASASGSSAQ